MRIVSMIFSLSWFLKMKVMVRLYVGRIFHIIIDILISCQNTLLICKFFRTIEMKGMDHIRIIKHVQVLELVTTLFQNAEPIITRRVVFISQIHTIVYLYSEIHFLRPHL